MAVGKEAPYRDSERWWKPKSAFFHVGTWWWVWMWTGLSPARVLHTPSKLPASPVRSWTPSWASMIPSPGLGEAGWSPTSQMRHQGTHQEVRGAQPGTQHPARTPNPGWDRTRSIFFLARGISIIRPNWADICQSRAPNTLARPDLSPTFSVLSYGKIES